MPWLHYLSYFFGGIFGANSIPHLVSGVMGRPFQSPFAQPPGKGLSSSTVNVLWGAFNLAIASGLILHVDVSSCVIPCKRRQREPERSSSPWCRPVTSGNFMEAILPSAERCFRTPTSDVPGALAVSS